MHVVKIRPPSIRPFIGLCYIVLDSTRGIRRGGTAALPEAIIDDFEFRKQYIQLGEAFAPLLVLWSERGVLGGSSVMFFIEKSGPPFCVVQRLQHRCGLWVFGARRALAGRTSGVQGLVQAR